MPSLAPAQTFTDSLLPGAWLTVTTVAGGIAFVRRTGDGNAVQKTTVPAASTQTFGPYTMQCSIAVDAVGQPCTVNKFAPLDKANPMTFVGTAAPNNADGMPDGTVYIQTS